MSNSKQFEIEVTTRVLGLPEYSITGVSMTPLSMREVQQCEKMTSNTFSRGSACPICHLPRIRCQGHYQVIDFGQAYIIHPLVFNSILKILNLHCHRCGRIYLNESALRFEDISASKKSLLDTLLNFSLQNETSSEVNIVAPESLVFQIDKAYDDYFFIFRYDRNSKTWRSFYRPDFFRGDFPNRTLGEPVTFTQERVAYNSRFIISSGYILAYYGRNREDDATPGIQWLDPESPALNELMAHLPQNTCTCSSRMEYIVNKTGVIKQGLRGGGDKTTICGGDIAKILKMISENSSSQFSFRNLHHFVFNKMPKAPEQLCSSFEVGGVTMASPLADAYNSFLSSINTILAHPINDRDDLAEREADLRSEVDLLIRDKSAGVVTRNVRGRKKDTETNTSLLTTLSGKDGLFRKDAMAKRRDRTGRSVAGPLSSGAGNFKFNIPDPEDHDRLITGMRQVGISSFLANKILIPEILTKYNQARLVAMCQTQVVKKITDPTGCLIYNITQAQERRDKIVQDPEAYFGWNLYREVQNNDPGVINRQPTLHASSIQCMQVRRNDQNTIFFQDYHPSYFGHLNLTVRVSNPDAPAFNMDFDGDEANYHQIFSSESRLEAMEICSSVAQIGNPETGSILMGLSYNGIIGSYLLTVTHRRFSLMEIRIVAGLLRIDLDDWRRRCHEVEATHGLPLLDASGCSGAALFSMVFPSELSGRIKKMVIEKGILVSGVESKKTLGATAGGWIQNILVIYGNSRTADFIDRVLIVTDWISAKYGLSLGYTDLAYHPQTAREMTRQHIRECQGHLAKLGGYPRDSLSQESWRFDMNNLFSYSANNIRGADTFLSVSNPLRIMTSESGAKGSAANVTQICLVVGAQYEGSEIQRPTIGPPERQKTDPTCPIEDVSLASFGFICHSWAEGVNVSELFLAGKAARPSTINLDVPKIGDIHRLLRMFCNTIHVSITGMVVSGRGQVIQFHHGASVDPARSIQLQDSEVLGQITSPDDPAIKAAMIRSRFPGQEIAITAAQIQDIVDDFRVPYRTSPLISTSILSRLKTMYTRLLTRVRITDHPQALASFRAMIVREVNDRFIAIGTPVGMIMANAIGQVMTQNFLNAFHKSGTAFSGVKVLEEALLMTGHRSHTYMVIHYKNQFLNREEVTNMSREITKVSIKDLILPGGMTYEHFDTDRFPHDICDCFWYRSYPAFETSIRNPTCNFRYRLRLRLDVTKLAWLGITTRQVAQLLEDYTFDIKKGSISQFIIRMAAIPSPTIFGFVDLFIKTDSMDVRAHLDHVLQHFLVINDFEKILIRGLPGVTNYITETKVTHQMIRSFQTVPPESVSTGASTRIFFISNRWHGPVAGKILALLELFGIIPWVEAMWGWQDASILLDYNPLNRQEDRFLIQVISMPPQLPWYFRAMDATTIIVDITYFNQPYVQLSLDQALVAADIKVLGVQRWDFGLYLDFINPHNIKLSDIEAAVVRLSEIKEGQLWTKPDGQTIVLPRDGIRYTYYYYGTTIGSNIMEINKHPMVDTNRTWGTQYSEIRSLYGLEALRNLVAMDIFNIVTSGGYVMPESFALLADILTHNGVNHIKTETLEKSPLDNMIRSDVVKTVTKFVLSGKEYPILSSSGMVYAQKVRLGTGVDFGIRHVRRHIIGPRFRKALVYKIIPEVKTGIIPESKYIRKHDIIIRDVNYHIKSSIIKSAMVKTHSISILNPIVYGNDYQRYLMVTTIESR